MRIRKKGPSDVLFKEEELLTIAKISDALAHPVRIRLLRFILAENVARRSVTNKGLVAEFDYAQATISQHLSKLRIGGLLDVRKKGTSSYYFARIGRLSTYMDLLKKIGTRNGANKAPGPEAEKPGFLRDGFLEMEDMSVDISDELHPEYYEESPGDEKNAADEMPSFLK